MVKTLKKKTWQCHDNANKYTLFEISRKVNHWLADKLANYFGISWTSSWPSNSHFSLIPHANLMMTSAGKLHFGLNRLALNWWRSSWELRLKHCAIIKLSWCHECSTAAILTQYAPVKHSLLLFTQWSSYLSLMQLPTAILGFNRCSRQSQVTICTPWRMNQKRQLLWLTWSSYLGLLERHMC